MKDRLHKFAWESSIGFSWSRVIEILLVIPSVSSRNTWMNWQEVPAQGSVLCWEWRVISQEEKGESPWRHKGNFEEDGEVDVWKLWEYFSRTSIIIMKSQGLRYTISDRYFLVPVKSHKTVNTVWGTDSGCQRQTASLHSFFSFFMSCLTAVCGWNLL